RRRRYFEGWYFKHVAARGGAAFAFIPGVSLSPTGSTAFVQMIDGATGATRWFPYPLEAFSCSLDEFGVSVGENRFSLEGIDVRLRDAQGEVEAHLAYTGITPLPFSIGSPNIMGPYAYVPFMECYHGVGSLDHAVTGEVRNGDRCFDFDGGRGYLEKDWGRSMPLAWIWAQVNGFAGPGSCLLFSLARIPWLGRTFPGFFALLAEGGRIHRFATYTGARVASARLDGRDLHVEIRDRSRVLRLHAERSHEGTLLAPVDGAMERRIAESIDARIRVRLETAGGRMLFEGAGGNAGLEIVGDPALIGVRTAGVSAAG
ncbi:MAG TPA: tocopherol cyclase family protein, partial [Desulfobacterales bacterium]|nr:tocopherol cyclase family protein [Desulfobacterales bacterium]